MSDRAARFGRLFWGAVVPVLFLVGLGWFISTEWETLAGLGSAPPGDLMLIAVLFAVGHFLNSTEFWLLYRAAGSRFGLLENWMLFTAGQLANHLPGKVGTVYRLRYMRVVHGMSYPASAAIYGANLVITLAAAALVGLGGVVAAAVAGTAPLSVPLLFLFGAVAAAAGILSVAPLPGSGGGDGTVARLWERFHEGFEELRRLPRTAAAVAALEVVKYGVTAWRFQLTFALIGIHEPIWLFLVLAPAAGLAGFLAITPGALGFREGFITGAGAAMGLSVSEGLLGATVDRAVILVTFVVLGGIGLAATYPRMQAVSTPDERPDE